MRAAVASGAAQLHVLEDDGEPVAAALYDQLPGEVVLLSNFAARPGRRGGGAGRLLYEASLRAVIGAVAPALVLAEVEHPDHHRADPAYGDPAARLRFYGRQGARIIDTGYVQPPLGPDLPPVDGLMLLCLHAAPELLSGDGDRLTSTTALRAALREMTATAPELYTDPADEVRLVDVADYAAITPVTVP